MKKIMILLSMVTICMSCAKEMNPAGNEGQSSNTGKREFVATMENVGTKTALDADLNVKWSKGDVISVFDETGKNFKFETQNTGSSVVFTQVTEGEMVGSTFYAVFPYNESATLSNNVVSTKMNTKNYSAGPGNFAKAWHNIMTAKTTNNELKFKNLASLVKFTVPEDLELKEFYFGASGMLAGSLSVTVGDDGVPSLTAVNDAISGITITPSGSAETFAPGVYYMPILPGTYKNFRTLMTWATGDVNKSDAFGLSEFKAGRNKVVNIGTLYDNREYYKWMTFENGVVNPIITWKQDNATLEVVDNPCSDVVNASAKVLKSDASARTSGIHGGFDFSISTLNENARGRIKAVKCQIYVSDSDEDIYFPRLDKALPYSINGIKPSGDTWTEGEYKSAFVSGQWNTLVFKFDSSSVANIKIRPMLSFAGSNVSATTGSRIVYLDNIGFSYIEE